jgi:hypothetical protein
LDDAVKTTEAAPNDTDAVLPLQRFELSSFQYPTTTSPPLPATLVELCISSAS